MRDLRPAPNYPKYPGNYINPDDYLEQYFYRWFEEKKPQAKRTYIPVWWTNLFLNNGNNPRLDFVQDYLNTLDPNDLYFTVVQMDDGITYDLPPDTLVFHAGGKRGNGTKIPIPLIASQFPAELVGNLAPPEERPILASFVGSITHEIRAIGYQFLKNENGFFFNAPQFWKNYVPDGELQHFVDVMKDSVFTLAFAGYGDSSFRLYQAMELGSIPVYISDRPFWLPFENKINWNEFCVFCSIDEIKDLPEKLSKISLAKRQEMVYKGGQAINNHFNLARVCENIVDSL